MKVQENQIAKIVSLAGEGRIPEFMDLIKTIIVVNGIVMKKNQLTSTKKIMQSYKTSAYVFTLTPEERYGNKLFVVEPKLKPAPLAKKISHCAVKFVAGEENTIKNKRLL